MAIQKPPTINIEDLIGEDFIKKLDKYDQQVRHYYIQLGDPHLTLLEQLLHLYSKLMVAIVKETPDFLPKFDRPTAAQRVLALSAAGSFRNLRLAHKLLLEGYFVEMHSVLRMAEQWLECAVVVEACPELAEEILKRGLETRSNKSIRKCMDNLKYSKTELGELYRGMRVTFNKLSQRSHPLKDAMSLITRKDEGSIGYFMGGVSSDEMFHKDTLAVTIMIKKALVVLQRHFKKLSPDWNKRFVKIKDKIERHNTSRL